MTYSFPSMLTFLISGMLYFYVTTLFITPLKYSLKKSLFFTIASFCMNLAICMILIFPLHVDIRDKTLLLTIPFIAFWLMGYISSVKGFKLLFLFFTVYWLNLYTYFGMTLFMFFYDDSIMCFLVQFSAFLFVCLYIIYFLRPGFFSIMRKIDHGWTSLMIIPVAFTIILIYFSVTPSNPRYNIDYIYVNILIFTLAFTVYNVIQMYFMGSSRFYEIKQSNELLIIENDSQYRSFNSIKKTLSDFDIFKENISISLGSVSYLVSEGYKSEAKDYILSLQDDINDFSMERFCTNYMVNTILSSYIQKAQDENISISHKLNIPENIHVENLEICVIFSNAIENAINACKKIQNPEDRFMSIVADLINSNLCIKITNSCIDDLVFSDNVPISPYPDHGFGTKSIISIAKKYDGFCSFEYSDGKFNLDLVL